MNQKLILFSFYNKRLSATGFSILGPISFIIILWSIFILSTIESPLGWASDYGGNLLEQVPLYLNYSFCFIFGYIIIYYLFDVGISNPFYFSINTKKLYMLSFISIFFMILKFINVGQIPLLGDPMSRYSYSLGGFPDYPTRFLPVISIYSYYIYSKTKDRYLLILSSLCILLPLLFTQRQDVIIAIVGIVFLSTLDQKISLKKIMILTSLIIFILLIFVGGLGLIRFGKDTLYGGNASAVELALWIVHGDISASTIFGSYVINNSKSFYYGIYTLGEYLSILNIDEFKHGAELIKSEFTDKETAQSIPIPFSFYLDFGNIGVSLYAIISGGFLAYFMKKAKASLNVCFSIIYILFYLQLLWSLRSGSIPFNPIFLYQIILLVYIFGNYSFKYYKSVSIVVYGSLVISFIFAFVRL